MNTRAAAEDQHQPMIHGSPNPNNPYPLNPSSALAPYPHAWRLHDNEQRHRLYFGGGH